MGVTVSASTLPGGKTPICNDCGIALCWDIADEEYLEAAVFWDAWICQDCNGGVRLSLKDWNAQRIAAGGLRKS